MRTIRRKTVDINRESLIVQGKLAKYGVFVKHLVAWGSRLAALSHRVHVSPVSPEPHVCTQKILNDREDNLSHGA